MGRIKTSFVKNLAKELIEKYPGKFSSSFEKNKEILKEILEIRSKKLRNILAGYIARILK